MITALRGKTLDRLRAQLAQDNARRPIVMTEIDRPDWPKAFHAALEGSVAVKAWRSKTFLAVLYVEPGKPARRLTVCRTQLNDQGDYQDAITWDELMRVKFECGYGDVDAVELYPRDRDVVNVANMRHLWILPELSELGWRAR